MLLSSDHQVFIIAPHATHNTTYTTTIIDIYLIQCMFNRIKYNEMFSSGSEH